MTVTEDIILKLSEERNGLSLAAPVVRVVAKYLVEVALIDDAKMVKMEDILDLAREAWRSVREVERRLSPCERNRVRRLPEGVRRPRRHVATSATRATLGTPPGDPHEWKE